MFNPSCSSVSWCGVIYPSGDHPTLRSMTQAWTVEPGRYCDLAAYNSLTLSYHLNTPSFGFLIHPLETLMHIL